MKPTVTIMTSEESFLNNYGAVLQGYALYSVLQDNNFDPQIVRYSGGQFQDTALRYYLVRAKKRAGKLYHRLFPNETDREKMKLKRKNKRKENARTCIFKAFQDDTMKFYNARRETWQQLKRHYPKTDFYICGSDQIWNPYFKGGRNDPGYFLAFAPEGATKIAYAPSFGCEDLPDQAKASLGELLKDFRAISVREKSGVEIVKKYAGRDAQWVLDPTLLRTPEQWKDISRIPEGLPDKYILIYRFADSGHTKNVINRISEELSIPVLSLPLSTVSMKDDYQALYDAGPREFIGLIEHASLVCTDSFHATVFSVLMNTPVCVFFRESFQGGDSMNTRVISLLEMLELKDCIISEQDSLQKALQCLHVDYTHAHEILADRRKASLDFLKHALEE
jgi:hypothetical protein